MKGGPMTRRAMAPGRVDILTDKTQLRQIRFAVCRWTLLLTAFLLNRTARDSYTSSLAVDPISVRPERSVAKSKATELAPGLLFDFAAGVATLRANGQCLLNRCHTVPMSCGLI